MISGMTCVTQCKHDKFSLVALSGLRGFRITFLIFLRFGIQYGACSYLLTASCI